MRYSFASVPSRVVCIAGALCLAACSEPSSPPIAPSTSPPPPTGGGAHEPGQSTVDAPSDAKGACLASTGKNAPIAKYDASACGAVPTSKATTCPSEKMQFTQCSACDNDDSVELCLEANDKVTLCAIKAIFPDARTQSGGGRAQCTREQTLVMLPMHREKNCPATHGAAIDEAWARLCAVAALSNVKKIVPTFYE